MNVIRIDTPADGVKILPMLTRRTTRKTLATLLSLSLMLVLLSMDALVVAAAAKRGRRNPGRLRAAKDRYHDGPFTKLRVRYNQLTPKGKLATGATVGFVGSRLAFGTVTSVVKVGAVAFVA
jgi:hypothetical protein